MLKRKNKLKYRWLVFLLAAVIGLGSSAFLPATARATEAEEEDADDAATTEDVLPEGPQNDLEIRATEQGVTWPVGPDAIWSDKAILIDLDTGVPLYEKNADAQDYPASTTKIMTAMLVLEMASMDEVVTFSHDSVNETEGSGIWRMEGEQLTVEQCMYALMLASANECAYALAEHVTGGDYDAFVQLMNNRAAELGCTNTNFVNPNGLPDDNHVTTARDLAKIARAAYQNETFRQIAGTEEYRIPATNMQEEEVLMYNHHKMICGKKTDAYLYEYATAGKTGYTKAALHTLVTFAEKDGHRLACVVLRSRGDAQYTETQALFEYGFANFSNLNIKDNETRFDQKALLEGYTVPDGKEVTDVQINPDAMVTLPAGVSITDATAEVIYDTAEDGSQTGTLVYTYGGNEIGRADILVSTKDKMITIAQADSAEPEQQDDDDGSTFDLKEMIKPYLNYHTRLGRIVLTVIAAVIVFLIILIAVRISRWRHKRARKKAREQIVNEAPVLEAVDDLELEDFDEPDPEELLEETEKSEPVEPQEEAADPETENETEVSEEKEE